MPSSHYYCRGNRLPLVLVMLAALATICVDGTRAAAQEPIAPKWEIFGGYSFVDPGTDIHGVLPGGVLPVSSSLESNPRGAGASITYDFKRWLGLSVDASTHWGSGETGLVERIDDVGFSNLSLGPKFTLRRGHFSPFLELLGGDHRLMPESFHHIDKMGFMAGGGLDINLSRHLALRLIRADYVLSNYHYGPSATTPTTGVRGVRLQAGINLMFGGRAAPLPASAVCAAVPGEIFAGEPVTANANGSNFNPRRTMSYNWSGTGVKVTGTGASIQIDTTGVQPGPYQVSANLSDGTKNGIASCSASFIVKRPRPPEISCSADPRTVSVGGTAALRSSASSPDNRGLHYSYSASAGHVSGTDTIATLNTAGAQPGTITVTCSVSDDRNPALTASATTMVEVEAPPPPAVPAEVTELETRLALRSIYFKTARPTEKNPGGGLVESQQEVLTSLATGFIRYLTFRPEAHLILSGHADLRGSSEYNKALAGRRVERAKDFLIEHGVPADNIEVQSFGKEDNLTADQVRLQISQDPELSDNDRQKILNNLLVIVMANNRRVDISLSTTGQQSVRRYPFNATDALGLISPKGEKESVGKKRPKKQ